MRFISEKGFSPLCESVLIGQSRGVNADGLTCKACIAPSPDDGCCRATCFTIRIPAFEYMNISEGTSTYGGNELVVESMVDVLPGAQGPCFYCHKDLETEGGPDHCVDSAPNAMWLNGDLGTGFSVYILANVTEAFLRWPTDVDQNVLCSGTIEIPLSSALDFDGDPYEVTPINPEDSTITITGGVCP